MEEKDPTRTKALHSSNESSKPPSEVPLLHWALCPLQPPAQHSTQGRVTWNRGCRGAASTGRWHPQQSPKEGAHWQVQLAQGMKLDLLVLLMAEPLSFCGEAVSRGSSRCSCLTSGGMAGNSESTVRTNDEFLATRRLEKGSFLYTPLHHDISLCTFGFLSGTAI